MRYPLINIHLGMGSPYLQMENGTYGISGWGIFIDKHTFGDGIPISTEWRMVPTVYLDEVSLLINIHLGMGSPYLQMENGTYGISGWGIFYDKHTFGDGVPISTDGEMVPTVYLDELHLGMGAPYLQIGYCSYLASYNRFIHLGMGSQMR